MAFKPYTRSPYPTIEGNDRVYFDNEFRKIQECLYSMHQVGTWDPVIGGAGGDPTVTYDSTLGIYQRVGRGINFHIRLAIDTISGGSGAVTYTLPFVCHTEVAGYYPMFTIFTRGVDWDAGTQLVAYAYDGEAYGSMETIQDNGVSTQINIADLAAGDEIYISGHYLTDE